MDCTEESLLELIKKGEEGKITSQVYIIGQFLGDPRYFGLTKGCRDYQEFNGRLEHGIQQAEERIKSFSPEKNLTELLESPVKRRRELVEENLGIYLTNCVKLERGLLLYIQESLNKNGVIKRFLEKQFFISENPQCNP